MSRLPRTCDRCAEVEAAYDGRLGARDHLSVTRHVAGCARCASAHARVSAVRQSARALPRISLVPLAARRVRGRVLRDATVRRPAVGTPWAVTLVFGTVAVLLGAGVAFAALAGRRLHVVRAAGVVPVAAGPRHGLAVTATPGASTPDAPTPGAPALPSADDAGALERAIAALDRGDALSAARDFEAFEARHAGDSRAEDAGFLQVVALSRAGRRDATVIAGERYLARYPAGLRRWEAAELSARAAGATGNCAVARTVLGPFMVSTAHGPAARSLAATCGR